MGRGNKEAANEPDFDWKIKSAMNPIMIDTQILGASEPQTGCVSLEDVRGADAARDARFGA